MACPLSILAGMLTVTILPGSGYVSSAEGGKCRRAKRGAHKIGTSVSFRATTPDIDVFVRDESDGPLAADGTPGAEPGAADTPIVVEDRPEP